MKHMEINFSSTNLNVERNFLYVNVRENEIFTISESNLHKKICCFLGHVCEVFLIHDDYRSVQKNLFSMIVAKFKNCSEFLQLYGSSGG